MTKTIIGWVRKLEAYVDRPWYPLALVFATFADLFIIIVPVDAIIVVSTAARPRKWLIFAIAMAVGSMLGALGLAAVTDHLGEPFINWLSPHLLTSETWLWTENFFLKWGDWALFGVAASPLAQQPTVLLAGLSEVPYLTIGFFVLAGRLIKFLSYAWISSHLPRLLKKLPGLDKELAELNPRDKAEPDSHKKE